MDQDQIAATLAALLAAIEQMDARLAAIEAHIAGHIIGGKAPAIYAEPNPEGAWEDTPLDTHEESHGVPSLAQLLEAGHTVDEAREIRCAAYSAKRRREGPPSKRIPVTGSGKG